MEDISITYNPNIKNDLDHFKGKKFQCKIIITDVKDEKYECELNMPSDWTLEMFQKMITQSFLLCDNLPKSVHIDYIGLNLEIMN